MPHHDRVCFRCRVKWAQREGLCRRWARALGLYTKSQIQIEAARVARREGRLLRVDRPHLPPKPVVVDGVEYWVVYDGSIREPEPRH